MIAGHRIVICFALTAMQCHLMPLSSGRKQAVHLNWVHEEWVRRIRGSNKGQCSLWGPTTWGVVAIPDLMGQGEGWVSEAREGMGRPQRGAGADPQ